MTTLVEHLTAVADAIREKEKSTDPIPAPDFPDRIRALKGGGGDAAITTACTISYDKNWYGGAHYTGDTVTYSLKITNTGDVRLKNTKVTQSLSGATFKSGTGYSVADSTATIQVHETGGVITVQSTYLIPSATTINNTFTITNDNLDTVTVKTDAITVTPGAGVPANQDAFAAMSWTELAGLSAACAQTDGADYKKLLGYTKDVAVSGVGTVKAKLIGINHDDLASGGKAGFTFQLTDGLSYYKPVNMQMNSSNSTSGGWGSSLMKSTNLPKIYTALPSDLKSAIKEVKKKWSSTVSGSGSIQTSNENLWLLSAIEVFGPSQDPVSNNSYQWTKNEGTWYEWYQTHNTNADRIIKQDSGSAYYWWLRSAYSSTNFFFVYSNGTWNYYNASGSYLPAAGFCI